jgi:hypothetical protein
MLAGSLAMKAPIAPTVRVVKPSRLAFSIETRSILGSEMQSAISLCQGHRRRRPACADVPSGK